MKVAVYWNLHKKCWSIQSRSKPNYGKVIAHAMEVSIRDVEFKVNQKGRDRVLRERKKNVHAYVIGNLKFYLDISGTEHQFEKPSVSLDLGTRCGVFYNPYVVDSFVTTDTRAPIHASSEAVMKSDRKVYSFQ